MIVLNMFRMQDKIVDFLFGNNYNKYDILAL